MKHYVLDSYAALALFGDERGAIRVEEILRQAEIGEVQVAMSLINLGEIVYIIERRWGPEKLRSMLAYLEEAPFSMVEANKERVLEAAHIKAHYPLAYADAFAIALTRELNAILLTGDKELQAVSNFVSIEWLEK